MKRRFLICATAALYVFTGPTINAAEEQVTIYTENFPPYNYPLKNGEIGGAATELVRQVMDATGLKYEIQMGPWARSVRNAQQGKHSLLYSMANTPERSRKFDWLVPIITEDYFLIGRQDDNRIISDQSIRRGEYTAVCMLADISCQLLQISGFPNRNIMRFSSLRSTGNVATMMLSGRADFYLGTRYRYKALLARIGLSPDTVKLQKFLGQMDFYLAAGKQSSPELKKKVVETFKRLQAQNMYKKLDPKVLHKEYNEKVQY